MNKMKFGDFTAVVSYDDDTQLLRGEFVGLNGGADFYADNLTDLRKEGEKSLAVFVDSCKRHNLPIKKTFSGRFNVRIAPDAHAQAALLASAENKSLNQFIVDAITAQLAAAVKD